MPILSLDFQSDHVKEQYPVVLVHSCTSLSILLEDEDWLWSEEKVFWLLYCCVPMRGGLGDRSV